MFKLIFINLNNFGGFIILKMSDNKKKPDFIFGKLKKKNLESIYFVRKIEKEV